MIKNKKYNFAWFIPLGALILAFYLSYQKISQEGETITIVFSDASGLEVGKTKIRYKNIDIGIISKINLSDNFEDIVVEAKMQKSASNLLRADSDFWVVRPQVSISGVYGLNTLLSGSYIAVSPGKSENFSRAFKALKEMPIVEKNEAGLRVKLMTNKLGGLKEGAHVYYHGMAVGVLEKIGFSDKFDYLIITAFIKSPYDKLINNNTRFWNVSGFKASLNTGGANIEMQSMESLLFGGISFNTPKTLINKEGKVNEDTLFTLYAHERDISSDAKNKEYYVLYFPESVRGLKVGAPVNFSGIDVGSVSEIRLIYDEKEKIVKVPVLITIEPERITLLKPHQGRIIETLVELGLSASLENGSLITGDKYIKLSIEENSHKILEKDLYTHYDVLPTSSNRIGRIADDIGEMISNIKNLPLKSIAHHLDDTGREIKELAREFKKQLQKTSENMNQLMRHSDKEMKQLNQVLQKVLSQMEQTLKALDGNSSLYFTLEKTLISLEKTSSSLNTLLKKLNQKPNALLLGE